MKVIDNSPVDKPATGKFVCTKEPVWQFEDNRLYILPCTDAQTKNDAAKVAEGILEFMDGHDYINDYAYTVLDEIPNLSRFPELQDAIKGGEFNLLMSLDTCSNSSNKYLLANGTHEDMYQTIGLMFATAERVTKEGRANMLKELLVENPKEILPKLNPIVISEDFRQNFLASGVHCLYAPTFGMAPTLGSLYEMLGLKGTESEFVKNQRMIEHLAELAERARTDKTAYEELTYVCKSVPSEYFANLFKTMSSAQLNKYAKAVNPSYIAAQSPMRIEICAYETKKEYFKTHTRNKNDGEYVIFFTKGSQEIHVSFKDKYCFIVYLIFLLDRYKKGDDIDTIDIYDKEKLYKKLYKLVYPHDTKCDESFNSLTSNYRDPRGEESITDADGNKKKYIPRKKKYSACLGEIRLKVADACELLGEFPVIHFIPSPTQHVHTKSDRIVVPYSLASVD